jgi:hypothetical protein
LQAEKPVSAGSNVILHGEIDMLSAACKETGLTLFSNTLPTTVKNVTIGSPAYFASIEANDKIISADFKDNKLCLSINRGGTPYYTEIRLSSQSTNGSTPGAANPNNGSASQPQTDKQMIAVGFRFYYDNHKVNYIDPNSDLFGKVHVGDIYVETSNSLMALQNDSHNNGLIAYPTFMQNGVLRCYPCRRKPINTFASDMTQRFQQGYGAIYAP